MTIDQNLLLDARELREPEIKAALIDSLYSDGTIYGDTVVISEMPISSFSRRADIVVANGHLVGFEIKSDADKTIRLSGQLAAYQKAFEGIVMVTGAKHLDECLQITSPTVGIIAIDEIEDNLPKVRVIRKPLLRKMNLEEAIQQMRACELYKLTRLFEANPACKRDRFTLEGIVRQLPPSTIRTAAIDAIKNRYRPYYENFLNARNSAQSTLDALKHLRRPIEKKHFSNTRLPISEAAESDWFNITELSLSVRPRRHFRS